MIYQHKINAFKDNFIWCLSNERNEALVVDPGCAESVESYLTQHGLTLVAILITHHHPDHTGGVLRLKNKYPALVYAFDKANFNFTDISLVDKQKINIMNINFEILHVPGHTLDHIAFFTETRTTDLKSATCDSPLLFCGDTLFSGGCGRLFEGSPLQMHLSLKKINSLPANTLVFCAHEYTIANLRFALTWMPNNKFLKDYLEACEKKMENKEATIPSTLEIENKINPFLRTNDPEILEELSIKYNQIDLDELSVFTALRKAKDTF